MGDDINAIKTWAQIFTDPAQLAATLSKNYLRHRSEIQADVAALTADWDAGNFMTAG